MIRLALVAITLAALAFPLPPRAQGTETYTARLGWVPTTPTDRPNVTGKGSATATLAGRKLTISGAFDGLAAPATVARLHRGIAKGARCSHRRPPQSPGRQRKALWFDRSDGGTG